MKWFLAQVGKANPWQVQALKMITGCKEIAYSPLSKILKDEMNLDLDKVIDISGITKGN